MAILPSVGTSESVWLAGLIRIARAILGTA